MKPSTKAKNSSVIRKTDRRVLLNHCAVGCPAAASVEMPSPPGPTAATRYQ